MRPLLFVNWSAVNARFTALMWTIAVVLAFVVFVHVVARGDPGHPAAAVASQHVHAAAARPR